MQSGDRNFHIFQDRNDIHWGQQWKQRLEESLDATTFLIPMITPGFFNSAPCRAEMERFLAREQQLGRGDLILPVYYVNCSVLSNTAKLETDPLAKVIAARQHIDWRELRFEPFTSPQIGRLLAKMATQIVEAMERSQPQRNPAPTQKVPIKEQPQASSASVEAPAQASKNSEAFTPKTEPPTLVVDAFHRGDYNTLNAAVAAAKPGDRILVRPGLYKEGIVIEKPIEIVGDGELGDVVIEANGENAILFKASMGRIANLTLRQTGGGNWYCVDIAQGRLDLEDCDISSQSNACVGIHNGADPRLRRNRIHDGKSVGVYVYENGQGVLEDNDIFANALAGVVIMEGSNPTLRRNRVHDGKQVGVHVYENGQGVLEDNDIFANALSGVEIKEGGNPTLRRNRIHDGKSAGVSVGQNGQGVLEDNDVFANELSNVQTKEGGNPTLRRNQIHDGKENGVLVWQNGKGILEDNDIFANAFSGVEIREWGNPTLRRNRISKNSYRAIFIHDGGQGVFEDNDLRKNARGAWNISPDCQDKVTRSGNQE